MTTEAGGKTPAGISEMTTLSMSQLPVLVVEVLKPIRPRLLFPVRATGVALLSVADGLSGAVRTKAPLRNTEKLLAFSVRKTESGPM
ncbi:hypothetical protein IMCC26134_14300 [Verrucomicrobia bacterium IMCC26134]|nr:hypothetical protein IMCC26134_14300 [Verrucomicrobia bacterium IMCC26134]